MRSCTTEGAVQHAYEHSSFFVILFSGLQLHAFCVCPKVPHLFMERLTRPFTWCAIQGRIRVELGGSSEKLDCLRNSLGRPFINRSVNR